MRQQHWENVCGWSWCKQSFRPADVLKGDVATGRGGDELAVLVAEVDREPVDLQLEQVAGDAAGDGEVAVQALFDLGDHALHGLVLEQVADRTRPRHVAELLHRGSSVLTRVWPLPKGTAPWRVRSPACPTLW